MVKGTTYKQGMIEVKVIYALSGCARYNDRELSVLELQAKVTCSCQSYAAIELPIRILYSNRNPWSYRLPSNGD